ncbi:MAG: hypothetical protein ABSC71_20305 [Candidatus Acidiferrales bacterium]|jgi:hypothetical protein
MINRKVVLILGAGASMPYGFPSGAQLKRDVIKGLGPNGSIRRTAFQLNFTADHINQFERSLALSATRSVDAYLEHRREFIKLGKVATACTLMPREVIDRLFKEDETDWYQYFFHKLRSRFEEFERNRVAVVTFNYDRSLECFLTLAIMNLYGKSQAEAAAKVQSVPIVHVYGQLGSLPSPISVGMAFGTPESPHLIDQAADSIQIVHEDRPNSQNFQDANRLIREAQTLCFVGFGYDETNLHRLLTRPEDRYKEVIGSAKGLTQRESENVINIFRQIGYENVKLDWSDGEALSFLRKHCPFD